MTTKQRQTQIKNMKNGHCAHHKDRPIYSGGYCMECFCKRRLAMANKRARRKAKGLCAVCGKEKPEQGFVTCPTCLAKQRKNQTYHQRKKHGVCVGCGGERDTQALFCSACIKKGQGKIHARL